ncbi:uncharacterized protein DDB_G0284459-like isoform X3 [Agrilus planipennis]|uniref:Uncharacterized protein DDB_G0284459-like isoform X2 n=1 Tax=Agrilus planipennis TaxID=224129 RepID=A0A7F5RP09_AGRPL|nr:uncharacterized protein DDB_G0284459-like isoform X2 [Agrilus planipennis]XP_025837687.1 uncharacterized protein DDB_G0284459-like isoform X3 [Agrilus planipennis]
MIITNQQKVFLCLYTNVRCHQGILDPDSGFCKCKPGWTSVPMNKDLFEPSLFQFHMCNMRVSSWNDVNNKKIKLTLILIAVFGVIVSIFIILFSFLLSIVYRCLNSGQEPITIFGNGTGSTSCSKRTDATTIKTPRTSASSCMDSRSPQSRKSFCSCSKSVCSAQSRQPNPPDTCQDKEQDALSKSSPDLYENKNPCNVIEKECLPRKKQKRKCCEDKQKENCPRSDDLSLTSSQTREQKCENYLPTLECNSKLTWSKYKWILSKKSCSSSACPSQKPCKKKAPKPKRKKCKRKCKPKKCKKPQIEEQTAKEKCETFLRNLKSTDSIPSLVGSSCSSLYRESTSCKSVKKKKSKNVSSKKKAQKCDCATSFTSVISSEDDCQDKGNTSLYIMNEIQKDQTPTISLESTKKSNSEKQPFHVFHSKQVHRVENQNVLEIINKLIENATPNRKTNRHYCSEPPCSISNTDITWGSSFESKSVTTDAQNNTKTKEMSNGKTSSTSIFGKRPNFHLMEMIELQLTSEHDDEETHADEEAKPIVEVESLKPIVETLNITRPQDFSTSDTSNFTPLDECKEIHLSFGTAAELTQKKRRKIPFLHHKKYSKISTSSTSSSQRCSPKSIKSKRRKSKSTSKNLQENIPLCSQRKDKVFQLLSSSEDTENSNLETKSKRQTKFYGLKNKFRKYLFTNGKEKIPDPANASSWTSFKETVSSTSHNKTLNDISNVPNTSREDTPSKLQNTVEDNSNKESPIRTPKTTNIPVPVSSTLVNKSSSTTSPSFSPRSCKIPGPIFSKRSPKQQKSSSPGPSSRFYVDPDYTNAQNTKAEPK